MTDLGTLVILGAGGHGKVAASVASQCGWSRVLFLDDRYDGQACQVSRWSLVGKPDDLPGLDAQAAFVAVGNAEVRAKLTARVRAAGVPLATLVAPSAILDESVQLGPGVLVAPGAIINVDAAIDEGAIINTGAIIEHDVVIGAFSHVCPGASLAGEVRVGHHSWIGIGATVRQGIIIGDHCLVGAGAAVVTDLGHESRVVGVPARPLADS